ncbi:hypothetical protein [Blautia wexlerae]|uniref:hypothetical protein n=1 Tax=Blautia wexlerae TaxID=418240 RepID=UPI00321974B2
MPYLCGLWRFANAYVNYKHVRGQSYDFVVMDNGMKISISEDRRKNISEQYCSMEDTFYVDE